jgi:Uma2 family endonuclease
MAENTKQYQWIVRLVENLKCLLQDQAAFVAGDLLWYPVQVEGKATPPCQAPDAMVVLGRPAGDRGSYKQWEEENIAPQVVFEIISPSNTATEMVAKQNFYAQHGVLEMYFYDPESHDFWGLTREKPEEAFNPVLMLSLPWVSPLLHIRFEASADGLAVFYPNGEPFKTFTEVANERDKAFAKLKELGIDPNTL